MIKKKLYRGKKAYINYHYEILFGGNDYAGKISYCSEKNQQGGHKAGMIAFFVLTCLCLVLSMFVSPVMFLVPTIIFGVIWYLFAFRSEVEYEYTYYDWRPEICEDQE